MWGQDYKNFNSIEDYGIIPTRVGTRLKVQPSDIEVQDHPHACGDKLAYSAFTICNIGSSPRVWGQAFYLSIINIRFRIIPTRVGTRNLSDFVSVISKDHPHACGDKQMLLRKVIGEAGSSPRV